MNNNGLIELNLEEAVKLYEQHRDENKSVNTATGFVGKKFPQPYIHNKTENDSFEKMTLDKLDDIESRVRYLENNQHYHK